jgi:nucleoredoxin
MNKGEDFDIVLVYNDDGEEEFKNYHASMPWLALPFGDRVRSKLNWHFQIKCVPTLIFIGPDGNFITYDDICTMSIHGPKAFSFNDSHLSILQRDMDEVTEKYNGGLIGLQGLIV